MDLDNFIIGKTKERRGEERGDLAKKKQQLLSKHRAAADDKNSQKTAATVNRLLPHGWKTPVDPPSNSCLTNIYMLTVNKHREKNSRVQRI